MSTAFLTRSIVALSCLGAAAPAWAGDDPPVRLIAHRGGVVDHERIENSLAAIDAATGRGYWMIEVDVRESRDGRLVVHHDANFERYYGDRRRVADMTWDEIAQLRSTPGGARPLEFSEFCAACRGRVRLMVDTKNPEHDAAFYDAMETALRDNGLLDTAYFIGTAESQRRFAKFARTAVDRERLEKAVAAGEPVADRCFLFEHGRDLDAATVAMAQRAGVPVVASINTFHYLDGDHRQRAAADIRRLRKLGVVELQIDSLYEDAARE